MKFFLFCAQAAAVIATLVLMVGALTTKSAPQEAALAGYVLAIAVVPYVFARAIQLWGESDRAAERHAQLIAAINALKDAAARPLPTSPAPAIPSTAPPAPSAAASTVPTESIDGWKAMPRAQCPACAQVTFADAVKCSSCGLAFSDAAPLRAV